MKKKYFLEIYDILMEMIYFCYAFSSNVILYWMLKFEKSEAPCLRREKVFKNMHYMQHNTSFNIKFIL